MQFVASHSSTSNHPICKKVSLTWGSEGRGPIPECATFCHVIGTGDKYNREGYRGETATGELKIIHDIMMLVALYEQGV